MPDFEQRLRDELRLLRQRLDLSAPHPAEVFAPRRLPKRLLSRLAGGRATRIELYVVAALVFASAGGISYAAASSSGGAPRAVASNTTVPAPESTAKNLVPDVTTATTTTTTAPPPTTTTTLPSTTTTTPATTTTTNPLQASWTTVGPGTASVTYSGALTGQLVNAVSYCYLRPDASSEVTVNGTLNGTPWVLGVESYDGQSGVWNVYTGQAGGGTGMIGQGYQDTASYPQTVSGVTQIDWSQGATFDVQLTSGPGQTPTGNVVVQGTVTC